MLDSRASLVRSSPSPGPSVPATKPAIGHAACGWTSQPGLAQAASACEGCRPEERPMTAAIAREARSETPFLTGPS